MFNFCRYTFLVTLFGCFLITVNFGSAAWGQAIHIILAADGADANIGNAVKTDLDNMTNLFRANVPVANLNLIALDANAMTPDGMLRSVENLNVAPNDAIVFYYSGHGAFDVNGGRQFLELTVGGKLYRDTLLAKIEEKKPRLAVLLTDCCNNEVNTVPGTRSVGVVAPIQTPRSFSPIFENLFVFCKGTVDLTSSQPGELSFVLDVANGSVFTKALIDVVNHNKTNIDMYWNDFSDRLGRESNRIFREKYPSGVKIPEALKGPGAPDIQTSQTVFKYRLPGEENSLQPAATQSVREGPRLGLRAVNHENVGVRITAIAPNSPASRADIAVGDIVTAINGGTVRNETNYSDAVDGSPKTMELSLQKADGTSKTVTIEMGW